MDPLSKRRDFMDEIETEKPWFKEGLRFKCTGCGKCCTGKPGYVFVSKNDVDNLAQHFSISPEEFVKKYVRFVEKQYALIDNPGSHDCIFLKDKRCTAYEARPVQCRTFPWWPYNLREESDWEETALRCEGVNHPDAPLVPTLHIETEVLTYLDNVLHQHFDL